MSYVVSIVRPDGPPIVAAEVHAAITGNGDFAAHEPFSEGGVLLTWRGHTRLMHSAGTLWVATPADEALEMMQSLAVQLGARVLGEEGEDLTDVPGVHGAAGKAGCAAPAVVLLLSGAGLCAGAGDLLNRLLGA